MHYTLTRLGRLEEDPTALATVTVYSPESAAVTLLIIVVCKTVYGVRQYCTMYDTLIREFNVFSSDFDVTSHFLLIINSKLLTCFPKKVLKESVSK